MYYPLITFNALQALAVTSEQCITITETSLKNITLVNFLIILILVIVVAANINEGKNTKKFKNTKKYKEEHPPSQFSHHPHPRHRRRRQY